MKIGSIRSQASEVVARRPVKAPSPDVRRLNLYLAPELFQKLELIAEEKGFQSPTEVIKQALRIVVLAHKWSSDPEHGLYWREGDVYEKVGLI